MFNFTTNTILGVTIVAALSNPAWAGTFDLSLTNKVSNFLTADACETGPIGTQCSDGAWYVGLADTDGDGAAETRVYAGAADLGSSIYWGAYKTDLSLTNITHASHWDGDGIANTDTIVSEYGEGTDGIRPTPGTAAKDCRDQGAEWYLPSKDELNLLWTNRAMLDDSAMGLDTSGGWYWSSTEHSFLNGWDLRLSDGYQYGSGKFNARNVRCFRR